MYGEDKIGPWKVGTLPEEEVSKFNQFVTFPHSSSFVNFFFITDYKHTSEIEAANTALSPAIMREVLYNFVNTTIY